MLSVLSVLQFCHVMSHFNQDATFQLLSPSHPSCRIHLGSAVCSLLRSKLRHQFFQRKHLQRKKGLERLGHGVLSTWSLRACWYLGRKLKLAKKLDRLVLPWRNCWLRNSSIFNIPVLSMAVWHIPIGLGMFWKQMARWCTVLKTERPFGSPVSSANSCSTQRSCSRFCGLQPF